MVIRMTDRPNTIIGKLLFKDQYIHNKVVRDKHFIRNKKRPLMDIMREDYEQDPEFWGNKTFSGKTVKELCTDPKIEIFRCSENDCNGILRKTSETINACGNRHFHIICPKCGVESDGEIDIQHIGVAETID